MPDPHVVYIVTGVVVLGLVGWVAWVLAMAPKQPPAPPGASNSHGDGKIDQDTAPRDPPPSPS